MKKDSADKLWFNTLSGCNEVQRRRLAGVKAIEIGWGGLAHVCKITRMSHHTVIKGMREVSNKNKETIARIRKEGAGRKKIVEKNPRIKKEIENIMKENTSGDPMSKLKWINKSTYSIADFLKLKGHNISEVTVGRILKEENYSLQSNKKMYEGKSHDDRDEQFRYINNQVTLFLNKKQPVISVDTKKKELVGNFKNSGRIWTKEGQAKHVNAYDFPSFAKGKVVPYGAYDINLNKGFVNVGISSDTSEFAVESIRQWWKQLGKKHYPQAKELLITADSGGSNGYRNRGWKYFLNQLSKETKMKITVLHFPPATSKWNNIEHRMFSFISMNWKGEPLTDYEVIINFIKNTTTEKGLKIYARLDKNKYEKGKKFSDEEMNKIKIDYHELFPMWNYTIQSK
jgi:hypothetical protein